MFNRSKRVREVEKPEPVNPVTGRPYGQSAPERSEKDDAELAAGQLALANAIVPPQPQIGFHPGQCRPS